MNASIQWLKTYELKAKKRLSQNFLVHDGAIEKIVTALSPQPGQTVIEIGPGLGALTEVLLQRQWQVLAIEKDPDMVKVLHQRFAGNDNLTVHHADALEDPLPLPKQPVQVIGNLPYHIASPLLVKLLTHYRLNIEKMVLMFQREVAQRITASPHSKAYGFLSVLTYLTCQARTHLQLKPSHFYPPPKVHSSVIQFNVLPQLRVPIDEPRAFYKMVKACFAYRRKTLQNNLRHYIKQHPSLTDAPFFPTIHCIDLSRRAESLSLEEFAALYNEVKLQLTKSG